MVTVVFIHCKNASSVQPKKYNLVPVNKSAESKWNSSSDEWRQYFYIQIFLHVEIELLKDHSDIKRSYFLHFKWKVVFLHVRTKFLDTTFQFSLSSDSEATGVLKGV